MQYFNENTYFKDGEKTKIIQFVPIQIKSTDKTYLWNKKVDRMDKVSQLFYGHPFGGNIILMANSSYGCNEDDIPDESILIIPYPFQSAVQQYTDNLKKIRYIKDV